MASLFVWDSERMDLKVAEMNGEHQKLIDLMNSLYLKNKEGATRAELLKHLTELAEFVVAHFQHEEAYMEKIKFPGLHNHKGIHQRLLSQLKQYRQDYDHSSSDRIAEKFFDFLTLWLSAHIQHIDMQYSPEKLKKAS